MITTSSQHKRRRPLRRLLIGLVAGLALSTVPGAAILRHIVVRPQAEVQEAGVELVVVERGDLLETVDVNGVLEPRDRARVSFPPGARVREVFVNRGDVVNKGDVVARLDTRDLEMKVTSAQADLNQAQQALDKLNAGPTEAELAKAAAAVARARANLATDSRSVQQIDVELAKSRLDTARQRVNDLQNGESPATLRAAEQAHENARATVTDAEQTLASTRDSASRAKTDAEQTVERGTQELQKAQRAYSDAFWDWDYVQRTGRHPTETTVVSDTGQLENRKLTSREVEQYRRALTDAEVALKNSEQNLQNLVEAAEQARTNEIREVQQAERAVEAARRTLADAEDSYRTASTQGVEATLLEARQALAEAKKNYTQLVDNPDRSARRAELEAALLEAVAAQEKLHAGPDPVELARARATLEQARATLASAEAALDAATLTAPIAGTVTEISLKPGVLTSSTDAISIADLDSFLIRGQVTEQDVASIQAGQQVRITVDSLPDEQFQGELLLVGTLPVTAGQQEQGGGFSGPARPLGGLYQVEIAVQNNDPRLRVGMATTARIEVLSLQDTLLIPIQAVEYDSDHRSQVHLLAPDIESSSATTTEVVAVKLGVQSGEQVQVLSGLSEGDQLLVPRMPSMPDSMEVGHTP